MNITDMAITIIGKRVRFAYPLKRHRRIVVREVNGFRLLRRHHGLYLAQKNQRFYVVKFLNPFYSRAERKRITADSNRDKLFFDHEVKILRNIDDPRIIRIVDCGYVDKRDFPTVWRIHRLHYKVYPYVNGESLLELIVNRSIRAKDRLGLAREICLALQSIHGNGIIHADFSPNNIIVTPGIGVMVVDFEFSRRIDAPLPPYLYHHPFLTSEYAAPEQRLGKYPITERIDIYALGVILYEIFTGRRYWRGNRDPFFNTVSPHEIDPTVSPTLSSAIMACLTWDPAKRTYPLHQLIDALV